MTDHTDDHEPIEPGLCPPRDYRPGEAWEERDRRQERLAAMAGVTPPGVHSGPFGLGEPPVPNADVIPDEPPEPEGVAEDPLTAQEGSALAAGGRCTPSDTLFPEVTARRGGFSFTAPAPPRPLTEWSKKELRVEVERLRAHIPTIIAGCTEARNETRRWRRKVKRLLKIIEKVA